MAAPVSRCLRCRQLPVCDNNTGKKCVSVRFWQSKALAQNGLHYRYMHKVVLVDPTSNKYIQHIDTKTLVNCAAIVQLYYTEIQN